MAKSQIIISDDFEEIEKEFEGAKLFRADEFKVEDAKEVIKEAHISTAEPKVLVLLANRYNIYAQNALLKILEEPPRGVSFILVAKSKSTFLPTVLSRLPVQKRRAAQEVFELESFDLGHLYELARGSYSKSQAKAILKGMLRFAARNGFRLSQRELEYFAKGSELIELNSNIANVLITAGLILLQHKKRRQ